MAEFREMRRNKQEMSRERTIEVLDRATSGVLAVLGDGDYPYAVPL
ncbi:MAG: 5-nitroimidazole antibiotic resistance protein, partial [Lentihominibacter sp.]